MEHIKLFEDFLNEGFSEIIAKLKLEYKLKTLGKFQIIVGDIETVKVIEDWCKKKELKYKIIKRKNDKPAENEALYDWSFYIAKTKEDLIWLIKEH